MKRFPSAPPWVGKLTHVGVTGTNGKTSTSALLAAILNRVADPVALVTTVGAWLGAEPWTGEATYTDQIELMRACLDRAFTNLTHDHLDAHGSPEHYFASKAQLFKELPESGAAILNGCDEVTDLLLQITPPAVRRLTYGLRSRGEPVAPLDLEATDVQLGWAGTRATVSGPALGDEAVELTVGAIGDVFLENALAAFAASLALDVPPATALAALAATRAPPGRFEVVAEAPHVVVDYAHGPDALRRVIEAARQLCAGDVHVVFGAGGDRDKTKRPELGAAAARADRITVTSDNPRSESPQAIADAIAGGLPNGTSPTIELDRRRAIEAAIAEASRRDVVLIAGKGHEGTLHVDGRELPFDDRAVARAAHARRDG